MAVDGDTAQVGPEVAGQLDIPQVTHLMEVSDISDTCMCVRKKAGRLLQRMEVDLPCVVTVGRGDGGTGLSHTDRLAVGSAAEHPSLG